MWEQIIDLAKSTTSYASPKSSCWASNIYGFLYPPYSLPTNTHILKGEMELEPTLHNDPLKFAEKRLVFDSA